MACTVFIAQTKLQPIVKNYLYRGSVDMCVSKKMPPRGFFGEIAALCDGTCRPPQDLSISEECKITS